jgi:hypothetical protein
VLGWGWRGRLGNIVKQHWGALLDLSAPSAWIMKPGAGGGSRNISQGPLMGGSKKTLYPDSAPGHQGLQSFIGIFLLSHLFLPPTPSCCLCSERRNLSAFLSREMSQEVLEFSADTGWDHPI